MTSGKLVKARLEVVLLEHKTALSLVDDCYKPSLFGVMMLLVIVLRIKP